MCAVREGAPAAGTTPSRRVGHSSSADRRRLESNEEDRAFPERRTQMGSTPVSLQDPHDLLMYRAGIIGKAPPASWSLKDALAQDSVRTTTP